MSRGKLLSHRLARIAPVLGLLIAGVAPFITERPVVSAQESPALLVDDAETANPDLVEVEVDDPAGFGASGQTLQIPPGYTVSAVGAGLGDPRFMDFDDAGNLLVGTGRQGIVYRFPFLAADGQLGEPEVLISGLQQPASVTIFTADDGQYLYVGEIHQVSRFPYDPTGPIGAQEVVIPGLPQGGHRTRTVAFGPDGMLYLAVGSSCNICLEQEPIRATVSRANPDGSELEIIATGLRNPVGLAFQPGANLLWATVNERDNQGNEIPPDLVTIVEEGANYGWPQCLPPDATPQEGGVDCSGIAPPTIGIQAHSAPLGLAFLAGEAVPTELSGDLIVAQHGSWNREPPAAPKLLLIDFEDGDPVAARDFVTGWQDASSERWGRPAGVVLAPDGSLIVSDDENGLLYRISAES
jgi:glucose/arabinose dehydrogenase